jgi:hypothetical protein
MLGHKDYVPGNKDYELWEDGSEEQSGEHHRLAGKARESDSLGYSLQEQKEQ